MRMASHPAKERKVSPSASSKIDGIIKHLFLPMLNMPTPDRTCFQADDDDVLRQVAEECPAALESEAAFVEHMVALYRRFQSNELAKDVPDQPKPQSKPQSKQQLKQEPIQESKQDPTPKQDPKQDPKLLLGQQQLAVHALNHVAEV
jgi:hypothetical protein